MGKPRFAVLRDRAFAFRKLSPDGDPTVKRGRERTLAHWGVISRGASSLHCGRSAAVRAAVIGASHGFAFAIPVGAYSAAPSFRPNISRRRQMDVGLVVGIRLELSAGSTNSASHSRKGDQRGGTRVGPPRRSLRRAAAAGANKRAERAHAKDGYIAPSRCRRVAVIADVEDRQGARDDDWFSSEVRQRVRLLGGC